MAKVLVKTLTETIPVPPPSQWYGVSRDFIPPVTNNNYLLAGLTWSGYTPPPTINQWYGTTPDILFRRLPNSVAQTENRDVLYRPVRLWYGKFPDFILRRTPLNVGPSSFWSSYTPPFVPPPTFNSLWYGTAPDLLYRRKPTNVGPASSWNTYTPPFVPPVVLQREAILVIGDVLTAELGLPRGRLMLTNQRYVIPEVNGVYVALSYLGGKAIANNNRSVSNASTGGMTEIQEVVMLYDIQIDVMSFNEEARTRKEEVFQALGSVYAQQAMEQWRMQIARMPKGFTDVSSLEETKIMNRYTTSISVSALLTKTKSVDYYDTFNHTEAYDG